MTRIGLVTTVHGRHRHLRAQLAHLRRQAQPPDAHVVVAMGDPEVEQVVAEGAPSATTLHLPLADRELPLAAARNLGAATVLERGADVVVLLDVDCLPAPQLLARYAEVARPTRRAHLWSGVVHYLDPLAEGRTAYADSDLARSRPHPARPAPAPGQVVHGADLRLFWSLSFAIDRGSWQQVGGFDEAYTGYGGEDTDLAWRVRALGGGMTWVGGAVAYHQHHPTSRPPVQHAASIVRNANLFHERWGEFPMLGWLLEMQRLGAVRLDAGRNRWVLAETPR